MIELGDQFFVEASGLMADGCGGKKSVVHALSIASSLSRMPGPLTDVTVVELGGIGPAPHCGMLLADLGADVIRVERVTACGSAADPTDVLNRGKRSIGLDLRQPEGAAVIHRLATSCDAVIEGFRPGVVERLGVGPSDLTPLNRRLVYGRITGWGQTGYLSQTAGHDIDYLAVSGTLSAIGPAGHPQPPLNLVADFGGGSLYLAVGVLAAIIAARKTGSGQVVDAAMVDGVAHLSAMLHASLAAGWWQAERESNLFDGGAPFYRVYRCRDGGFVAVGALEPQFYSELLDRLGLSERDLGAQMDRSAWPRARGLLEETFLERSRDEWVKHFDGSDACVAPVLAPDEAPESTHLAMRNTFYRSDGVTQPAPAPRFDRTPASQPRSAPAPGADTAGVLLGAGFTTVELDRLVQRGAIHIDLEEKAQ